MEELSMCRICLDNNLRMYSLDTSLQEMYEKLTATQFETKDRPSQVCYLCRARLQNCCQLQTCCLQSEEFFIKMIEGNRFEPIPLQNTIRLQMEPIVMRLSVKPMAVENFNDDSSLDDYGDYNINVESSKLTLDVKVEDMGYNDIDQMTKDTIGTDDNTEHDPLDLNMTVPLKTEDFSTENDIMNKMQPNVSNDESFFETGLEVNEDYSLEQNNDSPKAKLTNDICPKTAMVVLHRLELDNIDTGVPVLKKPKLVVPEENPESTVFNKVKTQVKFKQHINVIEKWQSANKVYKLLPINIDKETVGYEKMFEKESCDHDICKEEYPSYKSFKCGICDKVFNTEGDFQLHIRIHIEERPFKCDVYKKSRMHTREKLFECDKCMKSFSKRRSLNAHIRIIHTGKITKAQNLLIGHLKIDKELKELVFPRMRADETSDVAKKDKLICAFGFQYLKNHSDKNFVYMVSKKIRELAKLLIEIKKLDPSINDLFAALRPIHYDVIVQATKILGKYDTEKDRFETPSFGINISSSLKQCCNIAIMLALKKEEPYVEVDAGKIEADVKTLIQLIESNWKHDISTQAATDLNKNKKWNKVTIVPLAYDLKILKEYLNKKSLNVAIKIKEGLKNNETYTQLLETVYCRVLLLNRCTPGELQTITLHDYLESENNKSDKYKELERALTASERILVKKFKALIIRGKHGRSIPVLFHQEVQDDIKLLLSIKNILFTSTSNQFLFGNPNYENTICGYKVLQKHTKLSGAKNLKAISFTRLRKHLATLSQIFSMSENDMEHLATSMGLINGVHKKLYMLPVDVYQTAKISKLLILMEDGKADAYIGKSLEEIDLNMNEELDEEVLENDKILEYDCEPILVANRNCNQQISNPCDLSQAGPSGLQKDSRQDISKQAKTESKTRKRKTRTLVPWTEAQKDVVTDYFKLHIKNQQLPRKHECIKLKEKYGDLLDNKDWLKIKVFVQNICSKK